MKMHPLSLLSVGLLFTLLAQPTATQAHTAPVGYVLEIQGDWYLNGDTSRPLYRWQKLPPAGTINVKAPAPGSRVVIASLSTGEIIDERDCNADGCSWPIRLPDAKAQPSLLRVAVDTTVDFLLGSSTRYALARIRAFEPLSEAVIRLEGGEVDFRPVLRQTGRYYLRWRARPRAGAPGEWSAPVSLRAEPGKPALAAAPGIKPGLYEINLQSFEDGSYVTLGSSWALVITSPRYEKAAASYQQAEAMTGQWGSRVERRTVRQFLRAHLDYLAQQAAGKR